MIRILAISGSLRAVSSNSTLLDAAAAVAPADVSVTRYHGLAGLPHFNPDDDVEPAPAAVADFREQLVTADGVMICSPEYAHGVPGTLKNALDWIVGSGELVGKPVAVLNASPWSTYGLDALTETLTVMSATIVPCAGAVVPLRGRRLEAADVAADEVFGATLRAAMSCFVETIAAQRATSEA